MLGMKLYVMNVWKKGESSRTGYVRGLENVDKCKRRHIDSAMVKHAQTHHRGRRYVESSMKITGSFHTSVLNLATQQTVLSAKLEGGLWENVGKQMLGMKLCVINVGKIS